MFGKVDQLALHDIIRLWADTQRRISSLEKEVSALRLLSSVDTKKAQKDSEDVAFFNDLRNAAARRQAQSGR